MIPRKTYFLRKAVLMVLSRNDLENLLEDYQNAQFSIEEATEGLFSLNQADKYEEVSIGNVDKEAETNEKKTLKRDIIVVDDKELLARNSERIPKNTKLRGEYYF